MSDSEDEIIARPVVKKKTVLSDSGDSEPVDTGNESKYISEDEAEDSNPINSSCLKKKIFVFEDEDHVSNDDNDHLPDPQELHIFDHNLSDNNSESNLSSHSKIPTTTKPNTFYDSKHALDPEIFDAEGDSDENNNENDAGESDKDKSERDESDEDDKPIKKVGRWLNSKGASIIAKPTCKPRISKSAAEKKSKEESFKTHSESQRIIRESEVCLPYHQPVQFSSFRQFKLAIQSGIVPSENESLVPESVKENVLELPPENENESNKPTISKHNVAPTDAPKISSEVEDLANIDVANSLSEESDTLKFPHLPETPLSPEHFDTTSRWNSHPKSVNLKDTGLNNESSELLDPFCISDTHPPSEPDVNMPPPISVPSFKSKKMLLLSKLIDNMPAPRLSGCDQNFIDLNTQETDAKVGELQNFMDKFHSHATKPKKSGEKATVEDKSLTIVKKVTDEQGEHLELEVVPYKATDPLYQSSECTRNYWQNHRRYLKGLMREKRLQNYEERCKKYGPEIEKRKEREQKQREGDMSDDDEEWNVDLEEDNTDTSTLTSTSEENEPINVRKKKFKKKYKKKECLSLFDKSAREESDADDEEKEVDKIDEDESEDEYANDDLVNKHPEDESCEDSQSDERMRLMRERRQLCSRMAREGLDQGDLDLFASEYSLFVNKTDGTLNSDHHRSKLSESVCFKKTSRILSPYMSRGSPHPPRLRERRRCEMSPHIPHCDTVDGVVKTPDKLRDLVSKLKAKYGLAKHTEFGESSILLLPSGKTTDQIIKRYFKEQIRDTEEMNAEDYSRYQKLLLSKEPKIDPESEWNYLGLQFSQPVTFDYDLHTTSATPQGSAEYSEGSDFRELFLEQQVSTQVYSLKYQNSFNTDSSRRSSVGSINKSITDNPKSSTGEANSQDTVLLPHSQNDLSKQSSIKVGDGISVDLDDDDDDPGFRPVFLKSDGESDSDDLPNLPFNPDTLSFQRESQIDERRRRLFNSDSSQSFTDKQRRELFSVNSSQSELDHERRILFASDQSQPDLDKQRRQLFASDISQPELGDSKGISTFPPLSTENYSGDKQVDCDVNEDNEISLQAQSVNEEDKTASSKIVDDNEDDDIGYKRIPRVIDDSDDDTKESDEDPEVQAEDGDDCSPEKSHLSFEESNDICDDEKQEIGVHSKRNIGDFIESEAELSGSDVDSADENEDEDSEEDEEMRAFIDINNAEVDEDYELKEQVERVHNRLQIDQDVREVKYLQELYLEGGELYSENRRQKRFKWLGVADADSDDQDFPAGINSDDDLHDGAHDDSIVEDHRPRYSHGQGPVTNTGVMSDHEEDEDKDDIENEEESQLLNIGKKALKMMKKSDSETVQPASTMKRVSSSLFIGQTCVQKSSSESKSSSVQMSNSELSDKPVLSGLIKRGSFLNRSSSDMDRLSTMVKTSDTATLRNKAGLVCFSVGVAPDADEFAQNQMAISDDKPKKMGNKRFSIGSLHNESKKHRADDENSKRLPLKQSNSIFAKFHF